MIDAVLAVLVAGAWGLTTPIMKLHSGHPSEADVVVVDRGNIIRRTFVYLRSLISNWKVRLPNDS